MEQLDLDPQGKIAAPGSKLDCRPASFRDCLPEGYSDGIAPIGPAIERDCRAVFCGESFWLGAEAPVRCTLERFARDVFDFHAAGSTFDPETSGAEWWVQIRDPCKAGTKRETIGFHWDKDEDMVDECGVNVFPHLSTVTYLSAGAGAPTVVCEKRAALMYDDDFAGGWNRTHISLPEKGKHLSFDGGYLHGAPAEICTLISRAGRDGEGQTRLRSGRKWRRTQGAVRITFLVNVWFNHEPSTVELNDDVLEELSNLDSHLQLQLENKMAEVHVAVRQNNVTARLSCSFGAQGGEHVITLPLPDDLVSRNAFTKSTTLVLDHKHNAEGAVS